MQLFYIHCADNFYFAAGSTRSKAACVVYNIAVCRKLQRKAVALCNKLGKGAFFRNGGAVCGVYTGNKLFKARSAFVKLKNKLVRVLRRGFALLHRCVVAKAAAQLVYFCVKVGALLKRFCKFHM